MTENKRFMVDDAGTLIDMVTRNTFDYVSDVVGLLNSLNDENEQLKKQRYDLYMDIARLVEENEQLKQQKPFLKIIDDYFIQYEDGELFNLHKPSDIRSLMYILNRGNGYGELECEYNDLGKGDVD